MPKVYPKRAPWCSNQEWRSIFADTKLFMTPYNTLPYKTLLTFSYFVYSCWKHKMESKLNAPRPAETDKNMKFPAVFYPYRSKKLLHALANDMSDVIRKTSTTPNGGKEAKVVTYEDLLKDPEVMESMKKNLGLFI